MKVSIIGFGQMGQFMAKHLARQFNVEVTDIIPKESIAKSIGVRFVSLKQAAQNDIIFLFTPIPKIGECCKSIRKHVKQGTTIIEGCSVMTKPIDQMLTILPKNVDIIGIHPLFGPQSGKNGIKGLKLVFSPVRTTKKQLIKKIFQEMKLQIIEMTPEQHDKLMARTQALEQFIGRILINMNIKDEIISTPSFDLLLKLREMLQEDSLELFNSIQTQNPFAQKIREKVKSTIEEIEVGLNESS